MAKRRGSPEQKLWFTVLLLAYYAIIDQGEHCPAYIACHQAKGALAEVVSLIGYPNDFLATLAESALLKHKRRVRVRSDRFGGKR
jgi:hypothetical protein